MGTLDKIIILLNKQGKKQKELTDYLGISKNTFTNWKNSNNCSYLKHIGKIADYLGVSSDYLLSKTKPNYLFEDNESELNYYLRTLQNRPELRLFFSVARDATKEDIELVVKIIQRIQQNNHS